MSKEEQEKYMNATYEGFMNDKVKQMLVLVEFEEDYASNNNFIKFEGDDRRMVVEYNVTTQQDIDKFVDQAFNALGNNESGYPILSSMKKKSEGL